MHLVTAVFVRGDQRAQHQHCRARRPHKVGEERTDQQERRIHDGVSDEASFDVDAARDDKKRSHEQKERDVVTQDGMRNRARRR